jgi:hypothetical protein
MSDEGTETTETAEQVLDAILAQEAREDEERAAALVKEREEEHARLQRQARRDWLGSFDEHAIRRMAQENKVTAEDVKLWAEARNERLRRVVLQAGVAGLARQMGCAARLIDNPASPSGFSVAVARTQGALGAFSPNAPRGGE